MRGEEIVYIEKHNSFQPTRHFVDIKYYPDGMPIINEWPTGDVDRILLRPKNIQGFVAGIFWIQSLIDRGHSISELFIPFVPGSRQDRMNDKGDSLFTIKYVAEMINDLCINKITVVDPHSDVTTALINRCKVIKIKDFIGDIINPYTTKYDIIIAPDAGAAKRAQEVADLYKIPLIICNKTRDINTGAITGYSHPNDLATFNVNNRALVVDDICDGGATFLALYDAIKNCYAAIDLLVSHGLFTKGTHELTTKYRYVMTTDSFIADRPNVRVYPYCENLLIGV